MNLIRNSLWSLAGIAIPTAIAIPAIGYLARALGAEKFGLMTLAWAIVGYASLFDLGLSRAVSRYVSEHRGDKCKTGVALGTALFAVTIAGLAAMLLVLGSKQWLVDFVIKVSVQNRDDTIWGIGVVSITLPFLLPTLVIQGYLEGQGMFAEANLQRIISGCFIAGMPALFVVIESSFLMAMSGLLVARVLTVAFSLLRCNRIQPLADCMVSKTVFKEFVRFGGWLTVSNIIGPIMGYLDRFLLSSFKGAAFVANYTASAELVSRISILPIAISRSLFPQLVSTKPHIERRRLLLNARFLTLVTCGPLTLGILLFADSILKLWLGNTLGDSATLILKILAIGFLLNAYAQIPFTQIQAEGRSDITAKIHLLEIAPYLMLLIYLTKEYGDIGVAIAWSVRVFVDVILLEAASRMGPMKLAT